MVKRYSSPVALVALFAFLLISCSKDYDQEAAQRESLTQKLSEEINADSLQSYVEWMEGMGTRFALAENHRNVALSIMMKFRAMGYSDAYLDSFMIDKTYGNVQYLQWQYNVIATLRGDISPDSVCIVGAHYDNNLKSGDPFNIIPGANDNASGVAAALELARIMKKNDYKPDNTIEFVAFGAEELGLYGSLAYADKAAQNSKKIMLMLNNDMIAYEPADNPSGWTVNILDYDNSHELRHQAERLTTKYTGLSYLNDNTYNKQSDSYPFFRYGYEALFFFSNTIDPGYHSADDITSNCNFGYCREIVKISCALLVYNN